jgi:creatinine amidohydrolase/Fe(II)-dependent formamide hydrolase-like protein
MKLLTKLPLLALSLSAGTMFAQTMMQPNLEIEMMTWAEIKKAVTQDGFVNVVIYNGGVEQRGPQNVSGGHNLMARETAHAIAVKYGHTLVAPILPYSVNDAPMSLPWGTIGLTGPQFAMINEQVAEQLIKQGFKNVFLMGDHGGGQKEMGEVTTKLNEKYNDKGIHVYFCDEMYEKAQGDYWKWLVTQNLPSYGHAGIMDTSEMLYLSTLNGQDKGWVRKDLIKSALGDPAQYPGQPRIKVDPATRVNNGITGDARPSTPELGKRIFDMKVDYAVDQMKKFTAAQK